nr:hypothetical protein [Tanacetum cinerariifolium]
MSDSEDSTVTYTTVSSPYEGRSGDISPGVDGPLVMPEDPYAYVVAAFQALPPPDYVPGPEEPEQAPPSPVYIPYDEDDDDEEEEHPPLADSIPPLPALHVTARISFRPQPPILSFTKEDAERFLAIITPYPPIPLPAASLPLQLLSSERRADRPEVTLPHRKRLSIVHCPGYEAGESSIAAATRPIEGRRADYRFVDSVEVEIRRRRAEDIGYGIRDAWIDSGDVAEEEALTTLEGSTLGQTKIFQRVEALVDDSQYHYETGRLGHLATALGKIRVLQAREQACVEDPYAYVVAAFQVLPSPDYVPGLEEPEQAPPSPVYIPYVPEPVYLKYIPPEDDVFLVEEQPLPAAASLTAESLGYIPEPIEGRRADYGFVDSIEAEIRRRRAEDIGYGIRDTWIDPRDVAEEEALTTLDGVNTRVTELAAVQK